MTLFALPDENVTVRTARLVQELTRVVVTLSERVDALEFQRELCNTRCPALSVVKADDFPTC